MNTVESFLYSFWDSYAARDVETLMSCFVESDSITVVGTDPGEIIIGYEAVKKAFSCELEQADSIQVTDRKIEAINTLGSLVTVIATLSVKAQSGKRVLYLKGCRFTGTLIEAESGWKLFQTHISVPRSVIVGAEQMSPDSLLSHY